MTRKVFIIGIGAGDPDFVTVQAVKAMNRVDVFFIPSKGAEKEELARVRRDIVERHVRGRRFRTVEYDVPRRRKSADDYHAAVADWHDELEAVYGKLLGDELGASEVGAFLVWGDPTLYDSTMRILDRLLARGGLHVDYEVLSGISSVQALAARHKVALCDIGRSVLISTGRSEDGFGFPANADGMVVMLNAEKMLRAADGDLDIYWGAYLGMPDEILVSGKLGEVSGDIERLRHEARERKGWIMDSILLKKPPESAS